jgi:CBS domain-containing protein
MSEKDLLDLKVEDIFKILNNDPAVIRDNAILKDAVESITHRSRSSKVYVIDGTGILIGVITIEALLRQVGYRVGVRETGMISFFKFFTGIFKENVSDFMDKPVRVYKSDKLIEAMQLMVEHHLNDLPIVDDEGRIIGELQSVEILKHTKKLFDDEK